VENRDQEGTLTENIIQESIQETIFDNIDCKQFFLAQATPICIGSLHGHFGYNAVTRTAKAILDRTCYYSPNFDKATWEICKDCACMRCMITKDSLRINISKED
jgi:hypothetical protein